MIHGLYEEARGPRPVTACRGNALSIRHGNRARSDDFRPCLLVEPPSFLILLNDPQIETYARAVRRKALGGRRQKLSAKPPASQPGDDVQIIKVRAIDGIFFRKHADEAHQLTRQFGDPHEYRLLEIFREALLPRSLALTMGVFFQILV